MCARPSSVKPHFKWALNWKVCLFSALLMPLLTGLGIWQLQRADQKRTLQQSLEAEQAKPPEVITALISQFDAANLPVAFNYRQVIASGYFLRDYYWLLENKVFGGKAGFEVVMPMVLANDGHSPLQVVLVNRGWLVGGAHRGELPKVSTQEGPIEVVGQLAIPTVNVLHQSAKVEVGWPKRALSAQLESFTAQLTAANPKWQNVLPFVLYLSPASTAALTPIWQPVVMPAYKHTGYAVQWFSMAFVLLVLTVFANSNLASVLKRGEG